MPCLYPLKYRSNKGANSSIIIKKGPVMGLMEIDGNSCEIKNENEKENEL